MTDLDAIGAEEIGFEWAWPVVAMKRYRAAEKRKLW
jgi:hypothetical protein